MDIDHTFGNDLNVTANGNFAIANNQNSDLQRVLRRLLTNQKSYLWHLDYGAGLAAMLGQTVHKAKINAIILGQMLLEQGVMQNPPPKVSVQTDNTGMVVADIKYVDANNRQTSTITLSE